MRKLDLKNVIVRADRQRLAQIVTNMVSNAFKYSPEKSPVIVRARVDGVQLVIAVEDHGLGISKEDQEK